MRKIYVTGCLALAFFAVSAPAFAQSIGGGLGIANMNSASGGTLNGAGAIGGITGFEGTTASQTTLSSATTGLAGTRLTIDRTGASMVSEHNITGSSQITTTGSSAGNGISASFGGANFSGTSVSAGNWSGIHGFLGF